MTNDTEGTCNVCRAQTKNGSGRNRLRNSHPECDQYEECKQLAAAAVYRPLKGAALDKVLAEGKWPTQATQDYVENRNKNTVFIPMIESVRGVENLEKICSIPGVVGVFVGPNDMTVNMGIPNQYDHKDFIAILRRIIDTAAAQHVAAGCWFGEADQAIRTIRQGARLVVFSNDGVLFTNAISDSFAKRKARLAQRYVVSDPSGGKWDRKHMALAVCLQSTPLYVEDCTNRAAQPSGRTRAEQSRQETVAHFYPG